MAPRARPKAGAAERAVASAAAPRPPDLPPSAGCPMAGWPRPFFRTTPAPEGRARRGRSARGRGQNAAGGLPSAEASTLGYHDLPMSTPGPLVTELTTRTLIAPG